MLFVRKHNFFTRLVLLFGVGLVFFGTAHAGSLTITADKTNVVAGGQITFRASGGIPSYLFYELDNGTKINTSVGNPSPPSPPYIFQVPNWYEGIKVMHVDDSMGNNTSVSFTVTQPPNPLPTCVPDKSITTINDLIRFTASGGNGTGTYTWGSDEGDTTNSPFDTYSKSFYHAGLHTVTVTSDGVSGTCTVKVVGLPFVVGPIDQNACWDAPTPVQYQLWYSACGNSINCTASDDFNITNNYRTITGPYGSQVQGSILSTNWSSSDSRTLFSNGGGSFNVGSQSSGGDTNVTVTANYDDPYFPNDLNRDVNYGFSINGSCTPPPTETGTINVRARDTDDNACNASWIITGDPAGGFSDSGSDVFYAKPVNEIYTIWVGAPGGADVDPPSDQSQTLRPVGVDPDGITFNILCPSITPPPQPTLVIAPPSKDINIGDIFQFRAMYDPDGPGGSQGEIDVTSNGVTAWTFVNESVSGVATFTSNKGEVRGDKSGSVNVHVEYGGVLGGATALLNVHSITSPDFSISINPLTKDIAQGGSDTYTVTVSALNNFTDPIDLSFNSPGLIPTGMTGTFFPTFIRPGESAVLTLSTGSALPGAYTFIVKGQQRGFATPIIHTVNADVIVTSLPRYSCASDNSCYSDPFGTYTDGGCNNACVDGSGTPTFVVDPSSASVTKGGTYQFNAIYDPDGNGSASPITVTTGASWSATDVNGSNVATVSGGLAQGNNVGEARIRARYTPPFTGATEFTNFATFDVLAIPCITGDPECTPVPDFQLLVDPFLRSVTQGSDAVYVVSAEGINGFTSSISLFVVILSSGVDARTIAYVPVSITPGVQSKITIKTATITPGSYTFRVDGRNASVGTRSTPFSLTVTPISGLQYYCNSTNYSCSTADNGTTPYLDSGSCNADCVPPTSGYSCTDNCASLVPGGPYGNQGACQLACTASTGDIKVKRVGPDLLTTSAPSTEAYVDAISSRSFNNPTSFDDLVVAVLRGVYVTDVSGYDEVYGTCNYPRGIQECSPPTINTTPICDGTWCTLPSATTVSANTVTKVVVKYTQSLTGYSCSPSGACIVGGGGISCTDDISCQGRKCNGNACQLGGTGASCTDNDQCIATQRYTCNGNSCEQNDSGPYITTNCDAACPTLTHIGCQAPNTCAVIQGSGQNTCSVNSDCLSGVIPTLVIKPPSKDINVGQTFPFEAWYDQDGPDDVYGEQNVTSDAGTTWSFPNSSQNVVVFTGVKGEVLGQNSGFTYIHANYGSIPGGATALVNVVNVSIPDFTVRVTPDSQDIAQGASGQYTVTVTPNAVGFTSLVNLSLSDLTPIGLPSGFTSSYPSSVLCTGATCPISKLTINVGTTAAVGADPFIVHGTSGILDHTDTADVVVTAVNHYSCAANNVCVWNPSGPYTDSGCGGACIVGPGNPSFVVDPQSASITKDGIYQFNAIYDPDGDGFASPVTVTNSATWTANPSSVATIMTKGDLYPGRATGVDVGEAIINASYVVGATTYTDSVTFDVQAVPCATGCTPDFTLRVTPPSISVAQGSVTAPYTVTITRLNGFNGQIALTPANLPTGATAMFSPTTILGTGNTATFTIQTTNTTPVGSHTFDVQGTSGGLTRTDSAGLTVNTVGTPLTCSPSSQNANIGQVISVSASGGTGSYSWTGGGNPASGSGNSFSTSYSTAVPPTKTITVQDAVSATASCIVNVTAGGLSCDLSGACRVGGGGVSCTTLADCLQPGSATLTISPSSANISVDGTQQFQAHYDQDGAGTQYTEEIVTDDATWSSSNINVANFITPTAKGKITGRGSGVTDVTAAYNNITADAVVNVTSISSPDFDLNIWPELQTVGTTGSVDYNVWLTNKNEFNGSVDLSLIESFPAGITGSFSKPKIVLDETAKLTIMTVSAPEGTRSFRVKGISGSLDHEVPASIAVTSVPPPSHLACDPINLTCTRVFSSGPPDTDGCIAPNTPCGGGEMYAKCENNTCKLVPGSGSPECGPIGTGCVVGSVATLEIIPTSNTSAPGGYVQYEAWYDADGAIGAGLPMKVTTNAKTTWRSGNTLLATSVGGGQFLAGTTTGAITIFADYINSNGATLTGQASFTISTSGGGGGGGDGGTRYTCFNNSCAIDPNGAYNDLTSCTSICTSGGGGGGGGGCPLGQINPHIEPVGGVCSFVNSCGTNATCIPVNPPITPGDGCVLVVNPLIINQGSMGRLYWSCATTRYSNCFITGYVGANVGGGIASSFVASGLKSPTNGLRVSPLQDKTTTYSISCTSGSTNYRDLNRATLRVLSGGEQ